MSSDSVISNKTRYNPKPTQWNSADVDTYSAGAFRQRAVNIITDQPEYLDAPHPLKDVRRLATPNASSSSPEATRVGLRAPSY